MGAVVKLKHVLCQSVLTCPNAQEQVGTTERSDILNSYDLARERAHQQEMLAGVDCGRTYAG